MPTLPPVPAFLLAALLCAPMRAQVPDAAALAERAQQLATTLKELGDVEEPSDQQKQALAATRKQLAEFVKQAQAATAWTAEHFVVAGSPLMLEQPAAALAISEAGIKLFPESRFLWDHVGFAQMAIADDLRPGAARVAGLQAAEKSFRQALTLKPATFHTHAGLFQALDELGNLQGALSELQAVLADAEGKAAAKDSWLHLASLFLRLGQPKDALAAIDAAAGGTPDLDPLARPLLRVRAHAIAKDTAATSAAIADMLKVQDTPRTQLEAADALYFVGKKAEAAKLLAKLPALGKSESEEQRIGQLCAQSGAALAAYWQATDVTAKGPLRASLTKALDHHFLAMDATAKPKPKETELASSPRALAYVLTQAMESDEAQYKNWANSMLLVLCVQASADYKPSAFEAGVLTTIEKDRAVAADIPGIVLAVQKALGDPDASCALSGVHALERIATPPKPPTGK